MAAVTAKDIKNRIRSMNSTRQITRAMELVAASKLQKAQNRAIEARPYFNSLYETVNNIVSSSDSITSPYLFMPEQGKTAYIVIAGDRGLSGGYNNNVFKQLADGEASVIPVGKKAIEYLHTNNYLTITDEYVSAEKMSVDDCFAAAERLCMDYLEGEYNRVFVLFTNYVSPLTQTPAALQLLPLRNQAKGKEQTDMLYEPSAEAVLEAIIPQYVGSMIYGALCESRASEQAARRSAMDSATQNANEMIHDLRLQLNRARQAAITREITEIVAGT